MMSLAEINSNVFIMIFLGTPYEVVIDYLLEIIRTANDNCSDFDICNLTNL